MNELLPMITERDGIPVTTSRAVAEQFGKQHKNVIRDIETLISQLKIEPATADFAELNFKNEKLERR
jgi:Rha family phage regulatory protein